MIITWDDGQRCRPGPPAWITMLVQSNLKVARGASSWSLKRCSRPRSEKRSVRQWWMAVDRAVVKLWWLIYGGQSITLMDVNSTQWWWRVAKCVIKHVIKCVIKCDCVRSGLIQAILHANTKQMEIIRVQTNEDGRNTDMAIDNRW